MNSFRTVFFLILIQVWSADEVHSSGYCICPSKSGETLIEDGCAGAEAGAQCGNFRCKVMTERCRPGCLDSTDKKGSCYCGCILKHGNRETKHSPSGITELGCNHAPVLGYTFSPLYEDARPEKAVQRDCGHYTALPQVPSPIGREHNSEGLYHPKNPAVRH